MLASITTIFTIIAPIIFISGLGVFWEKTGRKFDTDGLTPLILNLGTPCLIISILPGLDVTEADLLYLGLASLAVILTTLLLAMIVIKLLGYPQSVMLPPLTFSNTGNMGLPLCLFAFGETGLGYATAFFAVYVGAQLFLTPIMASGQTSWYNIFKIPSLYAILFSFGLLLTGQTLPKWLADGVDLMGQITIPVMLFALGISLARLKVGNVSKAAIASLARLGIGVAVGFGVAVLFPLTDPIAAKVIILESAMPAAVFNYLFAVRYQRQPEDVAGVIVLSTLFSFILIPVLLWSFGV